MDITLPCGKEEVHLTLPERVEIIRNKPASALKHPEQAIIDQLTSPIGSQPLAEIAAGKKDACIVISDITRPVPNQIVLPPILETLEASGIARDKIKILIATGMHRPNLGAELESMVGKEIMENYRIINHYCQKEEEYREIMRIDGAPVEVNTHYLDADLKILTGLIEPHFYAGFSGGRKSILPGISSFNTMKFMHSFQVIEKLDQANCRLENNIFHQYAEQVTEAAGVDFIVNVVINDDRELAGVFGGDYRAAHLAGCKFVASHSVMEIEQELDLVITSAGGYPLDKTFYQVSKCLTSAKDILKKNGTIVVICGCDEQLGGKEFSEIMETTEDYKRFVEKYSDPADFTIDQWCAQNIYQAFDHAAKILIYSPGLSKEQLAVFHGVKIEDCQREVDSLLPDSERAAVIPEGPYVVGKIKS